MGNSFKQIGVVSLFTVASRILGLLRDIFVFAALGAGIWNSAFILAFTLPNLFRRLLGEGALTSALVPVFIGVLESEGRQSAFSFFNQLVFRLCLILVGTVGAGMALLFLLGQSGFLPARWDLGAELAIVLLPYMIFICLAAMLSAGLQCLGRFATAAATPVLLNLCMIAALGLGLASGATERGTVHLLCGGVLMGGLLQMLLPGADFLRQGWRPQFVRGASASLSRLWELFLPGLMGAAILQINILVSRLLAFSLDASSVSFLYLASRLMELPLGVFTIAVVTVYFPLLSRLSAEANPGGFRRSFSEGLRLILAITVPAGVGLAVLGEPILKLFQWGAFAADDVGATLPLLIIYGCGLPFYSVATFATRGLHANQDMVTPVRIAGLCLLSNAVLGVILMQFLGAVGLALGNVLSALFQAILLWRSVRKRDPELSLGSMMRASGKIVAAAAVMGLACRGLSDWVGGIFPAGQAWNLLALGLLVPGGATVYFLTLWLVRFEDMATLNRLLRERLNPARGGRG